MGSGVGSPGRGWPGSGNWWLRHRLLLRGYDTLTALGRDKPADILASDDPTHEISAAWGGKEQLRRLLACTTLAAARAERVKFNQYVT